MTIGRAPERAGRYGVGVEEVRHRRFSSVRAPARQAALIVCAAVTAWACDPAADPGEREPPHIAWTPCSADAPDLPRAFGEIEALLAERLEAEAIPGLAAGIVCGRELIWTGGYGVLALDDPAPVTEETLFRIASITKVFTATAVMRLQETGALSLDDAVNEHLPWFEMGRPRRTGNAPVTLRHLLTHTGGVPRDSRLTDFRRLIQPAREEAIAALPSQRLEAAPGEATAYSNLGYGILGEVIAEAAGSSYAEYLETAILAPLGMRKTLVHPTREDRTAWGHGPRRWSGGRAKAGFWELGFATPAGGMASSVSELSRFMALHLAPYVDAEPGILSPEAIEEMHRVHFPVDPRRGGSGLGWGVEISDGQHVVYHGGELPEQTSFLLIDLRTHLGVVVLANAQGVDANGLAQEVLRILRGAVMGPAVPLPPLAIPPA